MREGGRQRTETLAVAPSAPRGTWPPTASYGAQRTRDREERLLCALLVRTVRRETSEPRTGSVSAVEGASVHVAAPVLAAAVRLVGLSGV